MTEFHPPDIPPEVKERHGLVRLGERVQDLIGKLNNAMANKVKDAPEVTAGQADRIIKAADELEKTSKSLPPR